MSLLKETTEELEEAIKTMKKKIMMENWDDLVKYSKNKKRKFLTYFYENIDDMNYGEILDNFKKNHE